MRWMEPVAGALIVAVVLLDVFLTVLYARLALGVVSQRVGHLIFCLMRGVARRVGDEHRRGIVMSLAGPLVLVAIVGVWAFGMILGIALITHPYLGRSVTATGGTTPTHFITALYVAGDSMTTVGTSDMAPRTSFFRILYALNSLVGVSLITLTMTYLLEVYGALRSGNTFALKLHMASAETGDAAEIVAGMGAGGRFDVAYGQLAEMCAELASYKEAHHFHSVLMYFRFTQTHYAMPRLALLCLDSVALIRSALSAEKFHWLQRSAAVDQIWRTTLAMLHVVGHAFLKTSGPRPGDSPTEADRRRWRRRYARALSRLRRDGIATAEDEAAGLETYIAMRQEWEALLSAFSRELAYEHAWIDTAAYPGGKESQDEDDVLSGVEAGR